MYKRIQKLRRFLTLVFSIVSIIAFYFSWRLSLQENNKNLLWISNLLMGVGASFLASILYTIFNESTKRKYQSFVDESKSKREIVFAYYKNIDMGYSESEETFKEADYNRTFRWGLYFYEKINTVCHTLQTIQQYEHKLVNDNDTDSFISKAQEKYSEFLNIIKSKEENCSKEIAEKIIINLKETYELYCEIYGSVLHNATELEIINDKYKLQ